MAAARHFSRRRSQGLAVLLIGLLFTVDTAAWVWGTGRMAADLADWEAAQLANGVRISHAPPIRTGWPLAAGLVLPQVVATLDSPTLGSAAAPAAPADRLTWHASEVTLRIRLWQPGTLAIAASPAQSIARGDAPPTALTAGRLEILVPLSGTAASADAHAIQVDLPGGPLAIAQANARLDPTHLTLALESVTLPGSNLPFGGSIASLAVDGSLTVPLPPASDLRASLAAWRDAGGRLRLDHAAIHWGPLDAEGSGTLALDPALQPVANASLHLTGYTDLIDALVRAGAITGNEGRVATTLLGLMARSPAGAAPFVDLPLTLQDGVLAMGAMPLARVPHLSFP